MSDPSTWTTHSQERRDAETPFARGGVIRTIAIHASGTPREVVYVDGRRATDPDDLQRFADRLASIADDMRGREADR